MNRKHVLAVVLGVLVAACVHKATTTTPATTPGHGVSHFHGHGCGGPAMPPQGGAAYAGGEYGDEYGYGNEGDGDDDDDDGDSDGSAPI
jgi:hypothetical protein